MVLIYYKEEGDPNERTYADVIIRLNSSGEELWRKEVPGAALDQWVLAFQPKALAFGASNSLYYANQVSNLNLTVAWSAQGQELWRNTESNTYAGTRTVLLPDKQFNIVRVQRLEFTRDVRVSRLNHLGHLQWSHQFSKDEYWDGIAAHLDENDRTWFLGAGHQEIEMFSREGERLRPIPVTGVFNYSFGTPSFIIDSNNDLFLLLRNLGISEYTLCKLNKVTPGFEWQSRIVDSSYLTLPLLLADDYLWVINGDYKGNNSMPLISQLELNGNRISGISFPETAYAAVRGLGQVVYIVVQETSTNFSLKKFEVPPPHPQRPRITVSSGANYLLPYDQTDLITAAVESPQPIFFQWEKAGVAVSNATNSFHIIERGEWALRAWNEFGTTVTRNVTFEWEWPPLTPPIVFATNGQNLTISAYVDFIPGRRYQWYRNRTVLAGETNTYLVIPNMASFKAGIYELESISADWTLRSRPTRVFAGNGVSLEKGLQPFTLLQGTVGNWFSLQQADGTVVYAAPTGGAFQVSSPSAGLLKLRWRSFSQTNLSLQTSSVSISNATLNLESHSIYVGPGEVINFAAQSYVFIEAFNFIPTGSLVNPRITDRFQIEIVARAGEMYRLETTTNLVDWVVEDHIEGRDGLVLFDFPINFESAFFRVIPHQVPTSEVVPKR